MIERDNRSMVPTPPNERPEQEENLQDRSDRPGLTDVSGIATLPKTAPNRVHRPGHQDAVHRPAQSAYVVNDTETIKDVIAEKIEAMAWGPDLTDGRHVLYVMTDNDLYPGPAQRKSTRLRSTAHPAGRIWTLRGSTLRSPCIRPDRSRRR